MAGDPSTDAGPRSGEGYPLASLDRTALRRWAALVAARLRGARAELDALNVFPVPDGDTGTNLHLTVEGALADGGDDLARALLVHARGSSGVIASQLGRGWADGLGVGRGPGVAATGPVVAKALRRGDELAWAAVTEPVEGTVLSVSRAAADAAETSAAAGDPLRLVVAAVVDAAEQALVRTPQQLPALAAAGVVDAGGAGLVLALRALRDVVEGTATDEEGAGERVADGPARGRPTARPAQDGPAYEVMYLLAATTGPDGAPERLRVALTSLGDSVLVVGGDGLLQVHVHTDDPGAAVEAGLGLGTPRDIRITHFAAAAAASDAVTSGGAVGDGVAALTAVAAAGRRAALAVVACAGGSATALLCRDAGADVVTSAPGERASTGDVLRAVLAADAEKVLVLPNDAETATVAHQAALAAEEHGVTAVVAGSRSQVQVVAALAVAGGRLPAGADVPAALRSVAAAVDGCRYGAVAVAARDCTTPVGWCRTGDLVGTVGRDVVAVGTDAVEVGAQVVARLQRDLVGGGAELVTVLPGRDGEEVARRLRDRLQPGHRERDDLADGGLHVDVVGGGQPRYLLLLGCE